MNNNYSTSIKNCLTVLILLLTVISVSEKGFGQTTIVDYNFNSGSSFAGLTPTLATNITCSAAGSATFGTTTGTASGTNAFTANVTGNALTSAPNNTWTFTLGGTNLPGYKTFKVYFQAQRNSGGSNTVDVSYSLNGGAYTATGITASVGAEPLTLTNSATWYEGVFAMPTAANNPTTTLAFQLTIANSGTGSVQLDNFEVQGVSTPSLSVSATSLSFGNQIAGTSSTSQTFNLSGIFLTGFPSNITVTAPSTDFQVSKDNSTWGATTTIAYSSATLASTAVYVRFTPQSLGAKSGNVTFSGGGDATPPTVALTGTGTASAASDIIANAGYSYTSNIAYASYQTASPTALTTANSVGAFGLTIRDGGASSDADNLSTTLTNITFSTGGSTAIRTAALFNGTTNVSEVAVNGATTFSFSSLSLVAADNSTLNFELRVTFESAVTDDQQIQFTVTAATASAAGSTFAAADAGGAVSSVSGDNNRIEVTATKLVFSQQPSNVAAGAVMSPSVTITAKDANNNIDLDYATNVSLTTSGTFSGSATTSVTPVSGVATFSNIIFNTVGTSLTIAGTSGSLTATGNSSAFNVTPDALSDIIANAGYSYTSNIAYGSYQAASGLTTANSAGVFGLTIRDGGASADADLSSTTLTAITISTGGSTAIRTAALFNGTTNVSSVAVSGGTSITFSGLSLAAADNSTLNFELRVTFETAVTDDQQIQFTVTSATALATGSTFAAANAGGAVSSVSGSNNEISVVATKLVYGQQTTNVAAGAAMSPAVTIKAVDANNNVDIDYVSTVSLTTTATFGAGATTSVSAVAGVATFNNLVFTTAVTAKTIAGTSGSLTASGNSSTFNVTAFANVNTDYFRSIATANWNATPSATWQASHNNSDWFTASLTPDYNSSGVTIVSPNTISVSANVTVDQVVVSSGAELKINDGITLTINNGGGIDLDVFGTVQEIGTGSTGASISLNSGANITFENGGLYQHNFSSTTTQGAVPIATWADGSTCEIIGFTSNTVIHAANLGQSFYNFTWNCPNETDPYGMQGALTTIRNNFTMQNSGNPSQIVYGLGASTGSLNMTIGGDMIISGGTFDFLNSAANGGTYSLTIAGNYNQTGGSFYSDYSGNGGLPVHFTGSGKTYTQSAGTINTANINIYVDNSASLTLNNNIAVASTFTVSSVGTLYCGTTTISGGGSFTLSSGGTLGLGSVNGIAASGATGNIETTSRSFSTGGNYIYDNATSNQITGTGLPTTVASLTLNKTSGTVTLTNATNLTVTSTLNLLGGILINNTTEVDITNASATLAVTGYSTTSYVNGYLRRTVNSTGSYDFPVGNSNYYELATLKLNSSTGMSTVLGYFNTGLPATGPSASTCLIEGTPIPSMLDAGYWTITPNAYTAANYDITVSEKGYSFNPGAASQIGIIKRDAATNNIWMGTNASGGYNGSQGYYNVANQSVSGGIATANRTGVTSFSDFGIGYAGTPLPIELSSFNANVVNKNEVALLWTTEAELNNNYFAIERSSDGLSFDSIGTVNGAGTSVVELSYSFDDNAPLTGTAYYRLKQVDFDGTSAYSNLQSVNIQTNGNPIAQQVIPMSHGFQVSINSPSITTGTLSIVDNLGRILINKTVNLNAGVTNEPVYPNQLTAGIYFAVLQTSQQKIVTEFVFMP